MKLILASEEQASAIHALQMRAFAEEGRLCGTNQIPPLLETVEAIKSQILSQTVIVAMKGTQLLGSARGLVVGDICTVRGVIVEPKIKGQGLGSHLLKEIERLHQLVSRFQLTTNTLVPGNVEFYLHRGYSVDEFEQMTDRVVLAHMSKRKA